MNWPSRRAIPSASVVAYKPMESHGYMLAYRQEHAAERCRMVLTLNSQPQWFELH
jgi:hypothetical protein